MLADPQSISIGGTASSAARILTGSDLGRFVTPDGAAKLEVQTTRGSRTRTVARLITNVPSTDPLTGLVVRVGETIAITINRPALGLSDDKVLTDVKAFIAWLTANTDANLKKIIAGEN